MYEEKIRDLRELARSTSHSSVRKNATRQITELKLRGRVESCTACPLSNTRTQAVPWSGRTYGRADLVVVGEAPGADEDRQGAPFVGRSGRLLDRLLDMAGTSRERVAVVNTLACRPPGNRDPNPEELDACRNHFEAQLDLIGCWVGVALGGYAIANVLGLERGSVKVADYISKPVWKDGRVWVGAYHPAYALRAKEKAEAEGSIRSAIQFALAIRFGTRALPVPPWEQVKVVEKPGVKIGQMYDERGWVLVHSRVLGQQIVIWDRERAEVMGKGAKTKTGKRIKGVTIPDNLAHLPRYTLGELVAIGQMAKQAKIPDELVRTVHMVKHEFGGEVLLDDRRMEEV